MKPVLKKLALASIGLALLGSAYFAYKKSMELPLESRYRIEAVSKGAITQTVAANGTVNPVVLVSVGTQVSGTVTRLFVDFNDAVAKGQPLLELDRSLFEAQVRQSEANIKNVLTSLDLARANEARMSALFAKEYVSRQEYDQAVHARRSAEAQLAQAKASSERDKVNLGYTLIRSPVSGTVVNRAVDLGQTVAASLQTPTLVQIAQDLSEMRIDTSFAEADIGKIKVGQKVAFTVDAFPNRSFAGEVQQIRLNPTITQNVVTYNVRVSLSNPDHILLPGMTAYVNIAVAERQDVLTVNNAALRFKPAEGENVIEALESSDTSSPNPAAANGQRRSGERQERGRDSTSGTVYVLEGKALKRVRVRIGITDNRETEIISGDLKEGDRIIVGEIPRGSGSRSAGRPSSVGVRLF